MAFKHGRCFFFLLGACALGVVPLFVLQNLTLIPSVEDAGVILSAERQQMESGDATALSRSLGDSMIVSSTPHPQMLSTTRRFLGPSSKRLSTTHGMAQPPLTDNETLFIFTHHKTGTFLMSHLGKLLETQTGLKMRSGSSSRSGTLGMLKGCNVKARLFHCQNIDVPVFEEIQNSCPAIRAVHLVRDPMKLLTSAYIYHNHSTDTAGMKTGPKSLKNLTIKDGLRFEARVETGLDGGKFGTLPEMLGAHKLMRGDNRILNVDLEDFERDFDSTARRVFAHLLGSGHESIDQLVRDAAAHDTSRWDPAKKSKDQHVASRNRKREVHAALEQLRESDDEAVKEVEFYRASLGYA